MSAHGWMVRRVSPNVVKTYSGFETERGADACAENAVRKHRDAVVTVHPADRAGHPVGAGRVVPPPTRYQVVRTRGHQMVDARGPFERDDAEELARELADDHPNESVGVYPLAEGDRFLWLSAACGRTA